MHRRAARFAAALAATAIFAPATGAIAGTSTSTLTVTANVLSGCSIENGSLDFGDYTAGQTTDLDATGSIRVLNCPTQVTIAFDGGSSGDPAGRTLTSGSNALRYQLYRDPARTQIWGTGADARRELLLQPNVTLQVFGRIPAGQFAAPGTYSDSITVTMQF